MLSMSPLESSDVLSVAFSQNFDFYQLNVVAVVAVGVAVLQFALAIVQILTLLLQLQLPLLLLPQLLLLLLPFAMIDDANRSHLGYRVGSRRCCLPLPLPHPTPPAATVPPPQMHSPAAFQCQCVYYAPL